MKKRSERKKLCIRICLTVIAVVTALIFIMPIVLTISNSFMSAAEITSNYGSIFQKTDTGGKQYISQTVNLKFIPDMVTFSQYATVLFRKETVFDWIRQLSKQLEQYYRCGNEDAAYGYVNPYAVIITEDGMLCLLDINEPENEELLKQMKKKKLRMLFVRKERVLSQKTERSDDLYGLAKIMEFTAEKCLDPKAFTRKEERVWKRMLGKCYSSGKNAIKVLKNMQKEIGFLEREMERPRDKVSAKKILLAILAVCIMSAAIIGGTVKKPETKANAADHTPR